VVKTLARAVEAALERLPKKKGATKKK